MNTFYLVLRVVPTPQNQYANQVADALASCWVCDDDPGSAVTAASFKVRQQEWEIVNLEESPISVTEDDYVDKEIALERYTAAQRQGMSMVFAARSKDGRTSLGPIEIENPNDFILSEYLSEIAILKRKGRCLHFDAGVRCTESIDAHSIQKSAVLSLVAQNGKIYAPSKNFRDTKRSNGRITFTEQGVNKASTFRGFCGKHDNELFEPIDNAPLAPTPEQLALYAYRSLCREVFVKENAVALFRDNLKNQTRNRANRDVFDAMAKGSQLALDNLHAQKRKFDLLFTSNCFDSVRSVLFHSLQPPSAVFSGLLYPDFDFLGNQLQDLSNQNGELDLITFSFAPMSQGWAVLFAWHSASSRSCVSLMKSLATKVHDDGGLGDLLFRFVTSNCENLAYSPTWWDSLSEDQRGEITNTANHRVNIFSLPRSDYLVSGLSNIPQWEFDHVISDLE
jgi:hypothetical protein